MRPFRGGTVKYGENNTNLMCDGPIACSNYLFYYVFLKFYRKRIYNH